MYALNVTKSSKYGVGASKVTSSVLSSITLIPTSSALTFFKLNASPFFIGYSKFAFPDFVSELSALSHPALKSFAVIGSPFDHLSPSLRWNVHLSPSGVDSHVSASPATDFPFLSFLKSPSITRSSTVPPAISVVICGSIDEGSVLKFIVISPPLEPPPQATMNIIIDSNNKNFFMFPP